MRRVGGAPAVVAREGGGARGRRLDGAGVASVSTWSSPRMSRSGALRASKYAPGEVAAAAPLLLCLAGTVVGGGENICLALSGLAPEKNSSLASIDRASSAVTNTASASASASSSASLSRGSCLALARRLLVTATVIGTGASSPSSSPAPTLTPICGPSQSHASSPRLAALPPVPVPVPGVCALIASRCCRRADRNAPSPSGASRQPPPASSQRGWSPAKPTPSPSSLHVTRPAAAQVVVVAALLLLLLLLLRLSGNAARAQSHAWGG